ncbi:MAG TPA: response regulator transcription factor [Aggregatilineales bacterium]|nr:response regulator transcription factor [Anaerolineales bacterium]HRE46715.1 response regulator transcription factor [Aggregatilineales bacterium]
MNILILGDDVKSVNILTFILRQEGYDVSSIVDPAQIERVWTDQLTDLLILDEAEIDGNLIRQIEMIRGGSSVAMMLLSPPVDEYDLISAYEAGIDDFLVKPYSYQLFLAHVNAQLRRARTVPSSLVPNLTAANVSLDPERHTVTLPNGNSKQLTNLEFRLMYSLVVNRGHVLSTETLIEKVWGYTGEGDKNLLKSLISRLRSKVETTRDPKLITTVPGVGYMFSPD